MPRLSNSVRIGAASILLLSLLHIFFWAILALALRTGSPVEYPFNYLALMAWALSAVGIAGLIIAIGIFRARNWARIAAIALAALAAFFCALGIAAPLFLVYGFMLSTGFGIAIPGKNDLLRLVVVYSLILIIAVWWIFLFSSRKVAEQFSANSAADRPVSSGKLSCPPPIALLAWLMIASGALSAISWPLLLGKIPAMLFTHIFAAKASHWIWGVNTFLFLVCGIGLLKLQRWSYPATIALHVFWLVSLFVSQISPLYNRYISLCLSTLSAPNSYISLGMNRFPQWVSAILTAIPTALLIAGLFYYRRSFLQAVNDSQM
jgi:hypothetical protein